MADLKLLSLLRLTFLDIKAYEVSSIPFHRASFAKARGVFSIAASGIDDSIPFYSPVPSNGGQHS